MTKTWHVHQGEIWSRTYAIRAKTASEAQAAYARLVEAEDEDALNASQVGEPEYVEDAVDDVFVSDPASGEKV